MPLEDALGRTARILARGVRLRCPRCGETALFRGWFTMARECALCGLRFERAQGYWVGAIYVNYGVTVTIALAGYFGLWWWRAPSATTQLLIWAPFVAVFPLWFFRYSRGLWLALEYLLNPEP